MKGVVKFSGRVIDSIVTYVCVPGYKLKGDSTRKCGLDGKWIGVAPICICESKMNLIT